MGIHITKPEALGRFAALMGGAVAERGVSLRGGNAVLEALLLRGMDVFGLDVEADLVEPLLQSPGWMLPEKPENLTNWHGEFQQQA
jgi:hypothetical protein